MIRAKLEQMGLGATEEQVQEIRRRIESGVEALDKLPALVDRGSGGGHLPRGGGVEASEIWI